MTYINFKIITECCAYWKIEYFKIKEIEQNSQTKGHKHFISQWVVDHFPKTSNKDPDNWNITRK